LAKDFTPDRFAAAKDVASEFISGRGAGKNGPAAQGGPARACFHKEKERISNAHV